jgi:uncharacterized protein YukE
LRQSTPHNKTGKENNMEKYEQEAETICAAIKELAEHEEALENFKGYLSIHFDAWMKKWANTPYGIANEFEQFSKIR